MYGQSKLTKGEMWWLALVCACVIFTACEAPFTFAFDTRLKTWQLWSDAIFSFIFIVDLIYNIRKKLQEKIKVNNSNLSKIGAFTDWTVDIFSCIPFDIIFYFAGLAHIDRSFRLIRLLRLVRIIKIINLYRNLILTPKIIKIPAIIISSLIATHWISCLWVVFYPPETLKLSSYYIKAFYWSVTTLTTIGYGDIIPTTDTAKIFTMLIMISGVGVYGLIIGNVSRFLVEASRQKEMAREKLNELATFMKHYHVPERLQNHVFSYYSHIYSKRLSENDSKIISELPHAIRGELQVYMNMKLIRNLSVFRSVSVACLKEIAGALILESYAPGETIINTGEKGSEMYIVGHGSVEIILKDGSPIASLHEGQFFGETALLNDATRNANVRASVYCDLYKLRKEDFLKIIKDYPELLASMEKISQRRFSDKKASRFLKNRENL